MRKEDSDSLIQAMARAAEELSCGAETHSGGFVQIHLSTFCPACNQQELYSSISPQSSFVEVNCLLCDESFEIDLEDCEPEQSHPALKCEMN